jgi:uncharacterized protein (DUF1499 family)
MAAALVACAISVLGLLLLAGAGPIYRTGIVSVLSAFELLRWAAYCGMAGMAAAATIGAVTYWRGGRKPRLVAILAFGLGLVAFAIPYQWQSTARRVPPIHDITTDIENPPVFQAVMPLRADAPNKVERSPELDNQQRKGYPDIAPITLPTPPDQVFDRALAAAQDAGWMIVTADKSSGRIEATDTTRWFGFKDDIVVRLTPWGSGTRVDVRSVSRIGRSDIGTNARRIRNYLAKLRAS